MAGVTKEDESGSPSWGASFFTQTTEDVARAVAAAMNSPRPSVVYSSKNDHGGSQLQKLQYQVTKMIKGFSRPTEVKYTNYNPEILTTQKRQWAANFQLQYMDHKSWKEPTRLFESMVVVGLHPNCDIQALQRQYFLRKSEGPGKLRSALGYQNQSRVEAEPNLEPQVLFVYPPEKQMPLKDKDLLSFCFPGGLEVNAVERTPSMSELNEILFGQEHLKQRDLSFVFRLQGADNSTLYGCCVLVEELVQKPSGFLSLISDKQATYSPLKRQRHILTTQRCYCILSRLPFFELHFGVLNSIFMQERLERLTRIGGDLNLEYAEDSCEEENLEEKSECMLVNDRLEDRHDDNPMISQSSLRNSSPENIENDSNYPKKQMVNGDLHTFKERVNDDNAVPSDPETDRKTVREESGPTNAEESDLYGDAFVTNKQSEDRRLPNAILPLLRYCQYESSESSCSFQGSPCDDRNFRSDADDTETEDASFSGQEDLNDLQDILEWAKIISEYYRLTCPARGSALRFHPLEHLHPLEYHRPDETILHLAGSTVDLKSCSTGLEFAEAHNSLLAEEEATALSIWAVACMCGTLRLENVLAFFAGALLEKQIVFVCSNLGILSASVLSVIPLIRPYQWQSLLMPVLPNGMLEFLDAPVPYIVGIKNKTNEVQSKLTNNVILIDANRNQVKSSTVPQLPRQKELMSSLRPYHETLVGESYLGRRRPVYECTEVQTEAAKGFLSVLRSYLDSLCYNIRSHTITNVQSNDDKVSLLLKESFIDSFPYRDRPFMKLLSPIPNLYLCEYHWNLLIVILESHLGHCVSSFLRQFF
ncbi:DENN domain-containing protein 5B isoform C [Glycine soja]|uniref:DENN domain-containing protein 5B isoform C n=1 Tax=Glycine soja TaxID=3848 RepID=A0A445GUW8_GLYSO|nr:DENN domain-containing protein 5B isoform C [Glycine soja]